MTLAHYIQSCSYRVFGWGIWDCCLFAADVVKCQTGRDPAAHLRATYANEQEARAVIARIGGFAAIVRLSGATLLDGPPYQDGDLGIMKPRGNISAIVTFWQGRFLGLCGVGCRGLTVVAPNHVDDVYRLCCTKS